MTDKNISQYDKVVLLKDFPEYEFLKGDIGVVVEVYPPIPAYYNIGLGYMVEVFRDELTIGVELLYIADIGKL